MRRPLPPPFRHHPAPSPEPLAESAFARPAPTLADAWAGGARRAAFLRHWTRVVPQEIVDYAFFHLMRRLPFPVASALGAWVGRRIAVRTESRGHRRAVANLKRLRPELDEAAVAGAIRRCREAGGRTYAEMAHLPTLLAGGRVAFDAASAAALDRAMAAGPVITIGVHLNNWEVGAPVVAAMATAVYGIAIPLPMKARHRLAMRSREAAGLTILPPTPAGTRRAVTVLRAGGIVSIFCDELGPDGVSRAPFFFKPPRTDGNLAVATRLARLTGATLLPWYVERPAPARLLVRTLPSVRLEAAEDDPDRLVKDVVQLNAVIEPLVRERLDQWFWLDNRLER